MMKGNTGRVLRLPLTLIFFLLTSYVALAQNPFITTWQTDNPGISGSTSVKLPVIAGRTGYNFDVDWESDGVYDEFGVTGPITHDYGVAGTYTISIRGDFPAMQFANRDEDAGADHDDALKLIEVNQWGDIVWYSMSYAFFGCENMQLLATDAPNLSNVSSMNSMFRKCKVMNANVNHWDVSNVRDFFSVFNNCYAFDQPLDQWNMGNATTISYMFFYCKEFDQSLNTWNVSNVSNFIEAFVGCEKFNQPLDNWKTGSATSMARMFRLATAFDQDISSWDVSQVSSFSGMFIQASDFNQNLNDWNVSRASDFSSMFEATHSFDQPLDKWDMGNATNTSYMFSQSAFDQDISGWTMGRISDMQGMFFNNQAFNQPIGTWNVSNVRDMTSMFRGATAFEQDISGWNTSLVTDMSSMFMGATAFNVDIGNWNVGNVRSFSGMFYDADAFDHDLSGWNVSSATDMSGMFALNDAFDQDLKKWDVSQVTDMSGMFFRATAYDHDLGDWDIGKVTDMENMLSYSGLSGYHYDRTLIGWAASPTKNNGVEVGADGLLYCSGTSARNSLISTYGWDFTGDTSDCTYTSTAFITTWQTDNAGSSNSTSITIPTAPDLSYNYDVDWDNDGVYDEFGLTGDVTHDFGTAGTYTIRINGDFPRIFFDYGKANDAKKLLDVAQWGDIAWSSMENAFDGCENLNFSATDAPDLSRVTSLAAMLYNCTSYNSNINHWDVSTITDFSNLFHTARAFNQPLNNWDVSNGTKFREMFIEASAFNQNIGNWKVQNAKDMYRVFAWASDFDQDISGWDMSQVTTTYEMFRGASSFDQPIGTWNVGEVTNMYHMFWEATSFDQALNDWNVGKVENMEGMFGGATAFNQDLNDWNVSSVTTMRQMFMGASKFNGDITGWNVSNVQNMGYLFASTPFNRDIGNWNTQSVTTMLLMFNKDSVFNQDIGRWNVRNVKNMGGMFQDAERFNQYIGDWQTTSLESTNSMFKRAKAFDQDIGNWYMTNLKEMHGMFWSATAFDQDIGRWDVSNVEDMAYVFFVARKFNQDISNWNTGSATVMQNMFNGASLFNQDLGDWDVSQVENMSSMFAGTAIDQNFGRWDVRKVTDMVRMFSDVTLSTANYDSLLIGWNKLALQPGVEFDGGNSQYCAGATARAEMMANDSWTIADGGPEGTAPVAVCQDITLYLQADGSVSFSAADMDGGSSDNCSEVAFSTSRSAFDCSEVNTTFTESLTVSDLPGNSSTCTSTITLLPSLDFSCPADITLTADAGGCSAVAAWNAPAIACGATLTADHASGDTFSVGTTTVTYTAEDGLGNTNTCSFTVTVSGSPGFATCPADTQVKANTTDCSATVSWVPPTPSCSDMVVTSTHQPGDLFPAGDTEVIYTATAADGSTATCRFTVSVYSDLQIDSISSVLPTCFGRSNGSVIAHASGGKLFYRYAWYDSERNLVGNTQRVNFLAAGTYRLEVTDANGCTISQTYTLQQPEPVQADYNYVISVTGDDVFLVPDVEGGTPPYTYVWSDPGSPVGIQEGQHQIYTLGAYHLHVTDANGCTDDILIRVTEEALECPSLVYDIYPNPTSDMVTLNFGNCTTRVWVEVYDVLGRKVMEAESVDFQVHFSLAHLANGTYHLKITDGSKTRYERISLKK